MRSASAPTTGRLSVLSRQILVKFKTTCQSCGKGLRPWVDEAFYSKFDGIRCLACGPAQIKTEDMRVVRLPDAVAEGAVDSTVGNLHAAGGTDTNGVRAKGKRMRLPQHLRKVRKNNAS